MGQIKDSNKYPFDTHISGNEYVIGSDIDNDGKTMNYRLSDLAQYFSQYFASQNQSITLTGNITGGNGVTIVSTIANSSLISDKPVTTDFLEGDELLVLQNGQLKKIDAEIIINNSEYIPPSYEPTVLTGNGLNFLQTINRDNLGNIQGVSLGAIQDSTTVQKGVIRIAQSSEYFGGSTTLAIPPAALSEVLFTSSVNGTINFLPKFTGTSTLGNSVIREIGGNIGVGVNATEKLEVAGFVKSDGYKSSSNSDNRIFTTDGGEAIGEEDIIIDTGKIILSPLNIVLHDGNYTIPNVENKLIYITYEGNNTSGTDTITLPDGLLGQHITIMRPASSGGGTMHIMGTSFTLELDVKYGYLFYYNGTNWISFGAFGIDIM